METLYNNLKFCKFSNSVDKNQEIGMLAQGFAKMLPMSAVRFLFLVFQNIYIHFHLFVSAFIIVNKMKW